MLGTSPCWKQEQITRGPFLPLGSFSVHRCAVGSLAEQVPPLSAAHMQALAGNSCVAAELLLCSGLAQVCTQLLLPTPTQRPASCAAGNP